MMDQNVLYALYGQREWFESTSKTLKINIFYVNLNFKFGTIHRKSQSDDQKTFVWNQVAGSKSALSFQPKTISNNRFDYYYELRCEIILRSGLQERELGVKNWVIIPHPASSLWVQFLLFKVKIIPIFQQKQRNSLIFKVSIFTVSIVHRRLHGTSDNGFVLHSYVLCKII